MNKGEDTTIRDAYEELVIVKNKETWKAFKIGFKASAKDPIVEKVRKDLLDRSNVGIKKYGVTLDRDDLSLKDWLQHAYEETLDKALYLQRAIKEIEKTKENS